MNLIQTILIAGGTGGIILFNILLLHVNRLLSARGYSTSLYDDLKVFGLLAQAIVAEKDLKQRDSLVQVRGRLKTSLVISLFLFGAFCVTLFWWPVSLR